MRRIHNAALLAVGLLVVGTVGVQAAVTIPSTLNHTDVTTPVAGPVYGVVVHGDVGDVVVQTGPRNAVVFAKQWNFVEPTTSTSVSNGVLTVTTACPQVPVPQNNCAVDVTVTVTAPASVQAAANVGDITTKAMTGDEALQANVGQVHVTGLRANALTVRGNVSDITAELLNAPSATRLSTDNGDVSVSVPRGAYALTAGTGRYTGNVHVDGIANDPKAPRTLAATSHVGDVTVTGR